MNVLRYELPSKVYLTTQTSLGPFVNNGRFVPVHIFPSPGPCVFVCLNLRINYALVGHTIIVFL